MMKNILIIEDNKYEQIALDKMIHNIDEKAKTFLTDNIGEAYTISIFNDIDLFIVDIILRPEAEDDTSGMDFVDSIRKIPKYQFVPVIFFSSLEDPCMYAYKDLHCYSYMSKPIHYKEAERVISEAMQFRNGNCEDDVVHIRHNKIIHTLKKSDIVYIESHGGKMVIRTTKEELVLFYTSCEKILRLLKSERFFKCSRSIVVNQNYITGVDLKNNIIILNDNFGSFKISSRVKELILEKIKIE